MLITKKQGIPHLLLGVHRRGGGFFASPFAFTVLILFELFCKYMSLLLLIFHKMMCFRTDYKVINL